LFEDRHHFAAACDERISAAVPGSYFCTFAGSIGSIHHCNYIPGILKLGEMYDVAGLIAPRPFCAIAEKPDHCRLYEGDGGHRYYQAGAWPFLRQHFSA
jgi:hypothetical protein